MRQTLLARCRAAVERCDSAQGWGLGERERDDYAGAVAGLIGDEADADLLQTVVINYHLDHREVAALRDRGHPGHERAWAAWMGAILTTLRRAGLGWSSDTAIDQDDLAQMALLEIARDLPKYRYQSRLARWVQQVAVRCVQRHLRDSRAKKRAARPDSLDADPGIAPAIAEAAHPESAAHARQLAALVGAILAGHADRRLAYIFQLWAIEDRRVVEIGELLELHPSRVRALLLEAKRLLREHPAILAWRGGAPGEGLSPGAPPDQ